MIGPIDRTSYAGRRVLVTGGLGFIGSNLAQRLVELGAVVSVIDSSVADCGANPQNVSEIRKRVRIIPQDISDAEGFSDEIRRCDLIFNLAGEISHTWSMRFPERDMRINTTSQLRFLQVCRNARPGVRIVFAGTRQVYGRPEYLPVDEKHPARTVDFNGIHKLAASQYHTLLSGLGEIDATTLRLTNIYGPRMALHLPWQGFIATFTRAALAGEPLLVYGDGQQRRDPLFIDDAVNAFLLAGAARKLPSSIYNVGGAEPLPLIRMAEAFADASAGSEVRLIPFPESRKSIDIGDYYSDCSLIRRELGWEPSVGFEDGVDRTLAFYRQRLRHYLELRTQEPVPGPRDAVSLAPAAAV